MSGHEVKAPSAPSWKGKATGGAPTLEEHLDHCGLGRYQGMIFCMASVLVVADGPPPPPRPPHGRPSEGSGAGNAHSLPDFYSCDPSHTR